MYSVKIVMVHQKQFKIYNHNDMLYITNSHIRTYMGDHHILLHYMAQQSRQRQGG